MSRIAAREKFLWRGWEFRQSHATSKEVHWEMRLPKLRVRLIYRDIQAVFREHVARFGVTDDDPVQDQKAEAEWTALIHFQGLEEGRGESLYEGGNGVGASHEVALARAEQDFLRKCAYAAKLSAELRRGKPADS